MHVPCLIATLHTWIVKPNPKDKLDRTAEYADERRQTLTCVCSVCKMDEELRMSFSAPVLRQMQMTRKRSSLISALASAQVQRTDGARAPAFSRHPKLLIHLARVISVFQRSNLSGGCIESVARELTTKSSHAAKKVKDCGTNFTEVGIR
jgi:hypothetical protein